MKWKRLIISIVIPIVVGFLGSLIGNVQNGFDGIVKPSFTPPMIVFPIVWVVLYILMGISSYLVYEEDGNKTGSLTIYVVQLLLNSLWTFFFFNLNWFLFSFILVLIILGLVIIMTVKFYRVNKVAGILQIPYIIWLIFASILSFSVYLLN